MNLFETTVVWVNRCLSQPLFESNFSSQPFVNECQNSILTFVIDVWTLKYSLNVLSVMFVGLPASPHLFEDRVRMGNNYEICWGLSTCKWKHKLFCCVILCTNGKKLQILVQAYKHLKLGLIYIYIKSEKEKNVYRMRCTFQLPVLSVVVFQNTTILNNKHSNKIVTQYNEDPKN